jgi:lipase chaperone LimK
VAPASAPTRQQPGEHGSLRGAELDGSWDVNARGQVHPTRSLRRRFDQLLTLQGEANLDELTRFIRLDVTEQSGPAAASAVLVLWQQYLALRREAASVTGTFEGRESIQAALDQQRSLRRRMLGDEMATAFFADDEQRAQAALSHAPASAASGTWIDRSELTVDALERLQRHEMAMALWHQRIAQLRQLDAELIAAGWQQADRQAELQKAITESFDPHEAVRAKALLHLAP